MKFRVLQYFILVLKLHKYPYIGGFKSSKSSGLFYANEIIVLIIYPINKHLLIGPDAYPL